MENMNKNEYLQARNKIKEDKKKKIEELDSFMWNANRESRIARLKRNLIVFAVLIVISLILFKIIDFSFLVIMGLLIIGYLLYKVSIELEEFRGPFGLSHYTEKKLDQIIDELDEIKDKLDGPYGINSGLDQIKKI